MDNFLKELEEGLRGEVADSVVRDTLSYYRNYFAEQRAKGVTEQEVVASLGSGRIIARSVIDANRMDGRQAVYTSGTKPKTATESGNKTGIFEKIKTLLVIMAVTIVVLFIVGLFFRLVWMVLPVVLVIMLIVWLVKKL
ncbi:MAG: DUF1700 domain-containing protein [Lachnospira sp.]|nr:DUF1700 domain-containing protein [Lachnospira sp.]